MLVPVYTGKRPAVALVIALAHFQKYKMTLMPQNQVNLPKAGTQLTGQNTSAVRGDMIAGALFSLIAALLAGRAPWPVLSGRRTTTLSAPQLPVC